MPTTTDLAGRVAAALTAYRDGHTDLLPALVTELTPLLWRLARSQGVDAATAEDVVQTAWVRLLEHADRIEDPTATLKWLLTTVRRGAWQQRRALDRGSVTDPGQLPETATRDVPEDIVLRTASQEVLWRHVQALSSRCRHLLLLIAYVDRPNYHMVSEALGMPVGSIGPTRGRCLAKLRLSLQRDSAWGVAR